MTTSPQTPKPVITRPRLKNTNDFKSNVVRDIVKEYDALDVAILKKEIVMLKRRLKQEIEANNNLNYLCRRYKQNMKYARTILKTIEQHEETDSEVDYIDLTVDSDDESYIIR